jgi:hypothetical protein
VSKQAKRVKATARLISIKVPHAELDIIPLAGWLPGGSHMNAADISAVARHLFEEQGAKAIAAAAQKAAFFDNAGNEGQAKFWRRVQAALQEMRGPKES